MSASDSGNLDNDNTPAAHGADPEPVRQARVLCVDADPEARDSAARLLAGLPLDFDAVASAAEARGTLADREFDVLLIDTASATGDAFDLVHERTSLDTPLQTIMMSRRPTVDMTIRAMRAGAIDLLRKPFDADELVLRLDAAVARADLIRHGQRRVDRLKRICRRLNQAREEVTREVDILCGDLVSAYQDLADQVSNVSVSSEYSTIIRRELDVEALLRATLEYLLSKTGPTNAAIFLPTGVEDYSLGAYVNYDLPKDTVDVLLDHLADVLAPSFEGEDRIISIRGRSELADWLGDAADWLSDSSLLVFPCLHEGECLAIIALFRDALKPFKAESNTTLEIVRALFAEQLARVIRIHNRHKADQVWKGFDVEPGDQDDGLDFGGYDADSGDDYDNLAA